MDRNGLKVRIGDKKSMSVLRNNSFIMRGPKLFNSLPQDLRSLEGSMNSYKEKLDSFLELIVDITRLECPTRFINNSLDTRIS